MNLIQADYWQFSGQCNNNIPYDGVLKIKSQSTSSLQIVFQGKIYKISNQTYEFEGNGNLELRQGLSFTGLIKIDEAMSRIECKIGKVRRVFSLTKDGISLLVLETTEQQIEHCRQKLKNVSSKSYLQFVSGFRAQKSSLKNLKLFKAVAANIKPLSLNEQEMLALESSSKMIRCNMWQFSGEQLDGKPQNGVITFAESAFFNPEKFVSFTGKVYSIYKSGIAFRGFGQLVQRKENGIITLEGEIENGKLISQGRIIHENGVVQTGDFSKQAGEFTFTEPNGNVKIIEMRKEQPVKILKVFEQGKEVKLEQNEQIQVIQTEQYLYRGQVSNNKPHGEGQMFYNDGKQIQGTFNNGFMQGKCTVIDQNSNMQAFYERNVIQTKIQVKSDQIIFNYISGNEKKGYQVQVQSPDFMYVGGMNKDQEYDGEGTLTSLDQNEQMELKAVWSRGNVTKKISERIGSKVIVYESGNEQSGYKATVTNGSEKYSGEFKDAKYHGKGQLTRDGVLYDGEFEEGEMNGEVAVVEGPDKFAVYTYDRGEQKEKVAAFENKTYTRYSGSEVLYTYVGQMKNYKPNGYGKATYANKEVEDGNWYEGKLISKRLDMQSKGGSKLITGSMQSLLSKAKQQLNSTTLQEKAQLITVVSYEQVKLSNSTIQLNSLSFTLSQPEIHELPKESFELFSKPVIGEKYKSSQLTRQPTQNMQNTNSSNNLLDAELTQSYLVSELAEQLAEADETFANDQQLLIPAINTENYNGQVKTAITDGFVNGEYVNGQLIRLFEVKTISDHFTFTSGNQKTFYQGVLESDDSVTEGCFKPSGLRHGLCKVTNNDGSILTANFVEGKLIKRLSYHSTGKQIQYLSGSEQINYTGTIATQNEVYTGELCGELQNGSGKTIFQNGDVLEATYIKGKLDGENTLTRADGTKQIRLHENGILIKIISDNDETQTVETQIKNYTYSGTVDKDGVPHGHGSKKIGMSVQTANFVHGLLDGEVETSKPGFKKVEYYAKGKLLKILSIECDTVNIQFSNGSPGQYAGCCEYANGESYIGQLDDQFNRSGTGCMIYNNKERASGQWKNNVFNGKIKRVLQNKDVIIDIYADNKISLKVYMETKTCTVKFSPEQAGKLSAFVEYNNGDTYDGHVNENGEPNGFGIIKRANGDYLQGPYRRGVLDGDYVNYKVNGYVYKGSYHNGDGEGEYRDDMKARWENNKLVWNSPKWITEEEQLSSVQM
ncbi:Conserved_hypothetical protein [Hexamita inflata]|uniref:MORN repeat protein n=1 Tax=Hexamita inflata TaxID=28002 RepID=A0AA86TIP9_9EUKA|nr:Conserved hypothetical protein [Hexamita inflata]